MQLNVNDEVLQQIQSLTSIKLKGQDSEFFIEWLLVIGLSSAKNYLKQHPDMTLGQIVTIDMRLRSLATSIIAHS